MRRLAIVFVAALGATMCLAGLAFGAPAAVPADPYSNGGLFLERVLEAVKSSNWRMLAALAVIALVYAARRWASRVWPWLATDRGGAALVLATAMLGAVVNTWGAGKAMSLQMVLSALQIGFLAGGGYAVVKKLIGSGT